MEDVEYLPQSSLGTSTLAKAWVAVGVMAALLVLGVLGTRAAVFVAGFPFAAAAGWFAAYAAKQRLRTRLTAAGIESRRLRTRVIAWAEIRDVKVVNRVTVGQVAVMGSRASGRRSTRSGGGARKLSSVRVQLANGRWKELAMPVAWENAGDPEFANKARAIRERWQAAVGQANAR